MNQLKLILSLFFSISLVQAIEPQGIKAQIEQASKIYEQALIEKNETLLSSILADNFQLTTATGKRVNKKEMLANLKKDDVKYDKFESTEVTIEVLDNTAIETGKVLCLGTRRGKKINELSRYTDFWVLIKGKWVLFAEHSCFISAN